MSIYWSSTKNSFSVRITYFYRRKVSKFGMRRKDLNEGVIGKCKRKAMCHSRSFISVRCPHCDTRREHAWTPNPSRAAGLEGRPQAPPTLLHGIGSAHDVATLCSYNRYCGCPKGEKECMRGEDRVRPVQSSSIPSIDDHIPTFSSPSWLQQPLTSSSKQSQSDSFTFGCIADARVCGCSQVTHIYVYMCISGKVK